MVDPTDAEIEAAMAAVPADSWPALWSELDALPPTAPDHPKDRSAQTLQQRAIRHRLNIVRWLTDHDLLLFFDYVSWAPSDRYLRGATFDDAPVTDAVRMLTAVIRAAKFSGDDLPHHEIFVAALLRIRRWHGHGATGPRSTRSEIADG